MLLLEKPLVNIWMYATIFGPLGKQYRTYALIVRTYATFQNSLQCLNFFSPINTLTSHPFMIIFAPKLSEILVRVILVSLSVYGE
jgi:hypothetical protein